MQLVVELEELFQIEMDDVEYENIVMVSKLVEYIFEKTNRTEGHEEII
jgi:acyl carrier protein